MHCIRRNIDGAASSRSSSSRSSSSRSSSSRSSRSSSSRMHRGTSIIFMPRVGCY